MTGMVYGSMDFGGIRFGIVTDSAALMAEFVPLGGRVCDHEATMWAGCDAAGVARGPTLSVATEPSGFRTSVSDDRIAPGLGTIEGDDPTMRFGAPVPHGGSFPTATAAVHAALSVMTERVVRLEPDMAHLHAGVAVVNDVGVVVPAKSGVGKTTLMAALGVDGGVVTDELVGVDRTAGVLRAPKRPLSVKSTSFRQFAAAHPRLSAPGQDEFVWHVALDSIGIGHVPAVAPGLVVLPARRPGPVEIEAIDPGEALMALLDQCYDLDVDPTRAFDDLVWLVSQCASVRVRYGEAGDVLVPLAGWLSQHAGRRARTVQRADRPDDGVLIARLGVGEVHWNTRTREVLWLDPGAT